MERAPEGRVMDARQGVVFTGSLAWQVGQPTWRRGNFVWVAKPGVVPDVLVYTWKTGTLFSLLGDLECCVRKSTQPRRAFATAGHSRKEDFWEIRSCCSSQGILFWQREEREHNQKHRCAPQAVKFLLLLFNLGIFLQDQKIPIRMTPEGKATSLCSFS